MNAGPPALVVASSLPSLRAASSLLLSLARDAIPSRAQHSSIHPLRPGRADIVLAGAARMLRLLSGGRAHSDCVGRGPPARRACSGGATTLVSVPAALNPLPGRRLLVAPPRLARGLQTRACRRNADSSTALLPAAPPSSLLLPIRGRAVHPRTSSSPSASNGSRPPLVRLSDTPPTVRPSSTKRARQHERLRRALYAVTFSCSSRSCLPSASVTATMEK